MTLPTKEEIDRINSERPGDEIYPLVKDKIKQVIDEEKKTTEQILKLILNDMVYDFSIANSLDDVGKVLTYLAQDKEIEPPEFKADILMNHFSRISKLKLSLDFAKMIGLSGPAFDAVLKAEVERLWGDSNAAVLKKLLASKMASNKVAYAPTSNGVGVQVPRAANK